MKAGNLCRAQPPPCHQGAGEIGAYVHLSPAQCLASLGPWSGLLSLPADAQAPLGTEGWLRTGQLRLAPHTPLPSSPRSCFPVEPGYSCPVSSPMAPSVLRGQCWGPAPVSPPPGTSLRLSRLCTSLWDNLFKHVILPAIVCERHCCYLYPESVEAALYPQVWHGPKSVLFALLPPYKSPNSHRGHGCSLLVPASLLSLLMDLKPRPNKKEGLP